jgi:hypothetical protein
MSIEYTEYIRTAENDVQNVKIQCTVLFHLSVSSPSGLQNMVGFSCSSLILKAILKK